MFLFLKVDELFARPWVPIGAFLSWVTGRNNFFVARLLTVISLPGSLMIGLLDQPRGMLEITCIRIIGPGLPWTIITWILVRLLEKDQVIDVRSWSEGCAIGVRLMLTAGMMLFLPAGLLLAAACGCGLIGALYIATQNRPRRDSLLKRAVRWIKRHARLPQLGSTAPSPA